MKTYFFFTSLLLAWANNTGFPFGKTVAEPGFDPIIGQAVGGAVRAMAGTNPQKGPDNLTLTADWVISKGGEYFFSPSIPALKSKFAK